MLAEYGNGKEFLEKRDLKSVYIMQNEEANIKIGVSNNPINRKHSLQVSSAQKINLIYESIKLSNPFVVEKKIHNFLYDKQLCGEWFGENIENAIKIVNNSIEKYGELKLANEECIKERKEKILTLFNKMLKKSENLSGKNSKKYTSIEDKIDYKKGWKLSSEDSLFVIKILNDYIDSNSEIQDFETVEEYEKIIFNIYKNGVEFNKEAIQNFSFELSECVNFEIYNYYSNYIELIDFIEKTIVDKSKTL